MLPSGYLECKWIKTSGTQYIKPDYYCVWKDYLHINFEFVPLDVSNYQVIFGVQTSISFLIRIMTTGKLNVCQKRYGETARQYNVCDLVVDNNYKVDILMNKNKLIVSVNGTQMLNINGDYAFNTSTRYKLYEMCEHTEMEGYAPERYFTKCKMIKFNVELSHYMFIKNENSLKTIDQQKTKIMVDGDLKDVIHISTGKKISNQTPALRSADNVAGMYDTVRNIFLENAGTGAFEYELK